MKPDTPFLIRLARVSSILGGALRVLSTFIPYAPGSPGLELLYGAVDLLMLFGLIGIYAAVSEDTGWTGLAGFIFATTGLSSIVGPDPSVFGIDFYQAGAACLLAGTTLLSGALLLARRLHLAAALWTVSLILAVAGILSGTGILIAASGAVFGLGFVAAGLGLNNSSEVQARARK